MQEARHAKVELSYAQKALGHYLQHVRRKPSYGLLPEPLNLTPLPCLLSIALQGHLQTSRSPVLPWTRLLWQPCLKQAMRATALLEAVPGP